MPIETLTQRILAQVPGDPLSGLQRVDRLWHAYRDNTLTVPQVVTERADSLEQLDWDVVICGGTLGILLGAALARLGWHVAVIERGVLRGREQEWNISRKELQVLRKLDLLSETELEQAIATEYNPARMRFHQGIEFEVENVLNIGVDPVFLLDTLKQKFLAAGGQVFEHCSFEAAIVHSNGVQVTAGQGFNTRLLVDGMGHFSPIARQSRQGRQPDAVCLVVGSCATGYAHNDTGDLFASITPIQHQCQYFWEAFPARDGRTTYLFTYVDVHPQRPSLTDLFEDYLGLLPDYQSIELEQLQFKRVLYGFFPSYRDSPLRSRWDRILHVGDSSGSQSPLSFGGFGAMMRHLHRLTVGIQTALEADLLKRSELSLLQPYQPNLAVTWLFQKSMSVGIDQALPPDRINQLLSTVFAQMTQLGDRVLQPFLQDVVQFSALSQTLLRTALHRPALVLAIISQVGGMALLEWLTHYASLGVYTGLDVFRPSLQVWVKDLPFPERYSWQCRLAAWQFGSGNDYHKDLNERPRD